MANSDAPKTTTASNNAKPSVPSAETVEDRTKAIVESDRAPHEPEPTFAQLTVSLRNLRYCAASAPQPHAFLYEQAHGATYSGEWREAKWEEIQATAAKLASKLARDLLAETPNTLPDLGSNWTTWRNYFVRAMPERFEGARFAYPQAVSKEGWQRICNLGLELWADLNRDIQAVEILSDIASGNTIAPSLSCTATLEVSQTSNRTTILSNAIRRVLEKLCKCTEPTTVEALAGSLRIDQSAIRKYLNELDRKGLAQRGTEPGTTRIWTATDEGHQHVEATKTR